MDILGPRVRVPKEDFRAVFDVWAAYCARAVRREEIRDMTRHSKYIISILRYLETGAPKSSG